MAGRAQHSPEPFFGMPSACGFTAAGSSPAASGSTAQADLFGAPSAVTARCTPGAASRGLRYGPSTPCLPPPPGKKREREKKEKEEEKAPGPPARSAARGAGPGCPPSPPPRLWQSPGRSGAWWPGRCWRLGTIKEGIVETFRIIILTLRRALGRAGGADPEDSAARGQGGVGARAAEDI